MKLGVTGNAVTNWENGRARPDLNLLPALCDIFQVSMDELFGRPLPAAKKSELDRMFDLLTPMHQLAVQQLTETLLKAQRTIRPMTRLTYVDRPLAAGFGDTSDFSDVTEPIYLASSPLVDAADFVFPINGESMEPVYHDGDMVLVRRVPSSSELKPGSIGAFMIGNETYIKEYQKDGLHSLNPAFPTLKFTEDDHVYLIGQVTSKVDVSWLPTNDERQACRDTEG